MNITLEALQEYLSDRYGGWATEQSLFMKLVEEIGEVAEVLNKRAGRKASDGSDLQGELGTELADMLHYIVAIASINGIDLNRVVLQKDKKASIKYQHRINLEAYGQRDPVVEFKFQSYDIFDAMIENIKEDTVRGILSLHLRKEEEVKREAVAKETGASHGGDGSTPKKKAPVKIGKKVGPNDPCPCGSGKKYKKCCGAPGRNNES